MIKKGVTIREETKEDITAIKRVNDLAFKQPQEGNIVNKIRNSGAKILSLVAISNNQVVGHIFFSPVEIVNHPEITNGVGLAPMAILPKCQNQGIGTLLINEGVLRLKKQSVPFIIVLGHEHFYPRFGFEPASNYGLKCQWEKVPDRAFMILILNKKVMRNIGGIAKYRDEFNDAM